MQFMEFLNNSPGFAFIVFLTSGLLIGSFINVVTYRLPIMLNRQWQIETRHFLGLLGDPRNAEGRPFNLIPALVPLSELQTPHQALVNNPRIQLCAVAGKMRRLPMADSRCVIPWGSWPGGLLAGLLVLLYGVGLARPGAAGVLLHLDRTGG